MPDMPVCPHTLLFALFAILVTTSALNLRTDATSDDWRSEFSKLKAEFDHENGVLQQRVKAQDAKIAWLESQISASGAVRASRCAQGTTLLRNLALSLRFSITYRSCFQRREGRRNCTAGHLSECVTGGGRFGSDLAAAVVANRQLTNQNQAALTTNTNNIASNKRNLEAYQKATSCLSECGFDSMSLIR